MISSPGPIGQTRADDEVAARERQPVAHDLDQKGRVDVPAGEDRDSTPVSFHATREQRGDRRRARALDDQLCALEEQEDRLTDLLVGDGDDVVEQIARAAPT